MEIKLTLKQFFTVLAFTISAFVVEAQSYNNIEFIENKGQWDSRVKFKGDVYAGAFFLRSGGFTVLQYNQEDYARVRESFHGHSPDAVAQRKAGMTLRGHAYNV